MLGRYTGPSQWTVNSMFLCLDLVRAQLRQWAILEGHTGRRILPTVLDNTPDNTSKKTSNKVSRGGRNEITELRSYII